jgi:hypothetical protein
VISEKKISVIVETIIDPSTMTIQVTFLLSLVPCAPVISKKKIEMWKPNGHRQ